MPVVESGKIDARIREPGFALDERIYVNFGGPLVSDFLVRLGARPASDPKGPSVLEIHQPHPRGLEWATLEFPADGLDEGAVIAFHARLLPQTPVPVKLYGPDSERELASLSMNHVLRRYQVLVDGEAAAAAQGGGFRLGFCLPHRSWFVFQISGLGVELTAEAHQA